MESRQIEFEFQGAIEYTLRFHEKTLTDSVIGTLYVQKVAELLSKIEEVLEG